MQLVVHKPEAASVGQHMPGMAHANADGACLWGAVSLIVPRELITLPDLQVP